jgi:hypothetical protein
MHATAKSPPRTVELLALRALEMATSTAIAEWGMSALEAGFDSPALRRLAGLAIGPPPSQGEVEPLFDAALAELGIPDPGRRDVLIGYLDELAAGLASGLGPVDETLDLIHRRVVSPLNHSDDVQPWCYLWERLDPETFADIDDEAVREFARKWIERRR